MWVRAELRSVHMMVFLSHQTMRNGMGRRARESAHVYQLLLAALLERPEVVHDGRHDNQERCLRAQRCSVVIVFLRQFGLCREADGLPSFSRHSWACVGSLLLWDCSSRIADGALVTCHWCPE